MPTKKEYVSLEKNTNLALIGRALSHELRIEILTILSQEQTLKNMDLVTRFHTTKSNIHHHLKILKSAGLISTHYEPHHYLVFIPDANEQLVTQLLTSRAKVVA